MQIVASNSSVRTVAWKKAFQDAVFELDPTRLKPKLDAAGNAIDHRLTQILSAGSSDPRELMELEDAKRTIGYLAKHELQAEM